MRCSRRQVWLAMALTMIWAPAQADVKDGVDAWTRGDFETAVGEWLGPATQGDADAQFNLAQAYKLGRGVKPDLAKAEELFGKAAAKGHWQASDNYGLLLFQRGERAKALPYIIAGSDRGDPRAQYLLGIAHFNGDNVPKDWVRAYALVSLAQQSGLTQATAALSQMDQFVPLDQRQQSVALAQELAAQAQSTRARQLAAADLSVTAPLTPVGQTAPVLTAAPRPPAMAAEPAARQGPESAGADFTRPRAAKPVAAPAPPARPAVAVAAPKPAPVPKPQAAPRPAVAPRPQAATPSPALSATKPAPAPASASARAEPSPATSWRVQLGAFGVAGNAEALWSKLRSRPELAGHARLLVPAGAVTRLLAGGFSSQDAARSACGRLGAAGISCIVVRN